MGNTPKNNQNYIPKCWFRKDTSQRCRQESWSFLEKRGGALNKATQTGRPVVRCGVPSGCSGVRTTRASAVVQEPGLDVTGVLKCVSGRPEAFWRPEKTQQAFPGNSSTFCAEGKVKGTRSTAPHSPTLPFSLPRMTFKRSAPPHLASSQA